MTNDEMSEFEEMLATVAEIRGRLRPREQEFIDSLEERYNEHGPDMMMSAAQWRWLRDIHGKA